MHDGEPAPAGGARRLTCARRRPTLGDGARTQGGARSARARARGVRCGANDGAADGRAERHAGGDRAAGRGGAGRGETSDGCVRDAAGGRVVAAAGFGEPRAGSRRPAAAAAARAGGVPLRTRRAGSTSRPARAPGRGSCCRRASRDGCSPRRAWRSSAPICRGATQGSRWQYMRRPASATAGSWLRAGACSARGCTGSPRAPGCGTIVPLTDIRAAIAARGS